MGKKKKPKTFCHDSPRFLYLEAKQRPSSLNVLPFSDLASFFLSAPLGVKHLHAFRVICSSNVSFSAPSALTPTIPLQQYSYGSVTQSRPTLCDPMDCRTPGLPVHHQPPGFTQTHVHWVGDAIQPSHPLSSPFPTFSLSQHQGLFQRVCSSHQTWFPLFPLTWI